MSSKTAPDAPPRPTAPAAWSLAARLTAWNAGSAFALILAATGFLYWALARSLDREDDHHLAERVRVLRDVLAERPDDMAVVKEEIAGTGASRQHTKVFVRLLDAEGRVVAESPGMSGPVPPHAFPAAPDVPGEGANYESDAGRSFRVLAVRVGPPGRPPWVVQAAMDRSGELELLAEYRKNLWVVLAAALAVSGVVGYRIARRGLRPVRVVTDTARRIDPANLGERIDPTGLPAELVALADTFNLMLDRLEGSFVRLARFSADIAHELRTPVNNLRGEVEVALGKPRSPDEYRDVLASNLEECGRLARLIESLLFLARAENPQVQLVRDRVEVGRELGTVCDYYEAVAGEKGVKLAVAVAGPVPADVNRTLFQRAVGNLVENAVAHTPTGGTVTLSARPDDTSAVVEVADTGTGIPAAHLPHVFDRFYRADPARTSTAGNVGLGLSIVKSVVELHAGTVEITSGGGGTRVTMTFPRKMTKP